MLAILVLAAACGTPTTTTSPTRTSAMPTSAPYQHRWGGLYVRRGNDLVDAPSEDQALAKSYPAWPAKGLARDGIALTLLTARTHYLVGEDVRVIHVLDVATAGRG